MNLILLEPHEVSDACEARLSDRRAAHLLHVLGVARHDAVRIGIVDGPLGIGTVESIDEGSITLRCSFEPDTPARPGVDLLIAVPRPKVMRRLWSQIAALGVGQIILTNAQRVERQYFDTHLLEPASYRPLLIEGLQQARDTRLPAVSIHRRFRVLVEDRLDGLFGSGLRVVADPGATRALGQLVGEGGAERILLAIGPEGGWSAFELDLLAAHGFHPASMGRRTLRTDTATIALLALAHEARGHLPP